MRQFSIEILSHHAVEWGVDARKILEREFSILWQLIDAFLNDLDELVEVKIENGFIEVKEFVLFFRKDHLHIQTSFDHGNEIGYSSADIPYEDPDFNVQYVYEKVSR
jgi:hypothetical protein